MAPKVLHLSTYDANGGAARAAHALHRAMLGQGVESRMHVARKGTDDPTVSHGDPRRFLVASELDRRLWRLQRSPVTTWRSPARFGSLAADRINRSSADVVNLHWVTDGFLTVEAIGRIDKPIVWSMYDMWPFAGTEHYGADTPDARWRAGYSKDNRPVDESGVDLDRWTYERKLEHWRTRQDPMTMVPASGWLEAAVRSSALMGDWPITRIPHVVDTDTFAPMDADEARQRLHLPTGRPTVLFLASAGIGDHRKGWDLLAQALPAVAADAGAAGPLALPHSAGQDLTLQVLVVGPVPDDEQREQAERQTGVDIHWFGTADSSAVLRLLYCAADVTAVPSREDNMPLTAMEAQSCGRPVAAFRIGGLPDIVDDGVTGHLAAPENPDDLARALTRALDPAARTTLQDAARAHALATWSPQAVVPRYEALYVATST